MISRSKEDSSNYFSFNLNIKFIFLDKRPVFSERIIDEAIWQVEVSVLNRAVTRFLNEISRLIRQNQKMYDLEKLLEIKEFSIIPVWDQLKQRIQYLTHCKGNFQQQLGEC